VKCGRRPWGKLTGKALGPTRGLVAVSFPHGSFVHISLGISRRRLKLHPHLESARCTNLRERAPLVEQLDRNEIFSIFSTVWIQARSLQKCDFLFAAHSQP
jgi:hypothetical protein